MIVRMLLFCLVGALPLVVAGATSGSAAMFYIAGVVLSACFLPVAIYGPKSIGSQFVLLGLTLLIVTSFCTWTEAMVFLPAAFHGKPWQALIGGSILYLAIGAVLAVLARMLRMHRDTETQTELRSPAVVVPMLIASGIAYMIYYLIFGAITFFAVTHRYYPTAAQDAANLGWWFWAMQIGRGSLMTLAVLPIIGSLRLPRLKSALAVGTILWVAGGAAPLIMPNEYMGGFQRFVHVIEIFTQNFALGVTAVFLLTRPRKAALVPETMGTTAGAA